jgi:quinol monooxygenase YgiN
MSRTGLKSPGDEQHMELFIFARFHAREGKQDAVETALREEIPQARDEPGCLTINAYRSAHDPRLFFIHSRWTDEKAFDAHAEMPHTSHFIRRIEPLIDHALDVNRTYLIEIPARVTGVI